MKTAIATLQSISPYSQSRHYSEDQVPRANEGREGHDDYRKRTWREHCHYDPKTHEIFIPPGAFKNLMSEAAKFKPKQIPGKGKSTYTKHIEAGIMVTAPVGLGVKVEDVASETLFLPADGRRGSGGRIFKTYPIIPEWQAQVTFFVLDETVTKQVFLETLEEGGSYIGLGRFRPRNNGFYGRFKVTKLEWLDEKSAT